MADSPEPKAATAESPTWFSARKIIVNLVGFGLGVGLFAWIVIAATKEGDWGRLREASPLMVFALLGCTAISAIANGSTFFVTIRPFKHLRWTDLQLLNLAANMLNYAPLRLGAIARVAYHLRVDRLTLLQLAGWFAIIGYILMLGAGSCVVATLMREQLDLVWFGLVAGQMILGALAIRVIAGYSLVAKYARGLDAFAVDRGSLWGATILRGVDLAAYTGRMAAAAAILQMSFPATQIVLLAMVALAASLIPFGRVGFREACVALAASRLGMQDGDVEQTWAQLALVESMGEALFFIPLGGLSMFWFRRKWTGAAAT